MPSRRIRRDARYGATFTGWTHPFNSPAWYFDFWNKFDPFYRKLLGLDDAGKSTAAGTKSTRQRSAAGPTADARSPPADAPAAQAENSDAIGYTDAQAPAPAQTSPAVATPPRVRHGGGAAPLIEEDP